MRPNGATNANPLVALPDELTKVSRRGAGWQAIAIALAPAGFHKLNGAPSTVPIR